MIKDICRVDIGVVKGEAKRTSEGYLRADARVTRTGIFYYRNSDGTPRRELRHPDEVFKADSMGTMKMIPVTNDHPPVRILSAETAKEYTVGTTGESVRKDEDFIMCPFVVTDKKAVADIEQGKREISLGYKVDLLKEDGEYNGERYDYRQTNIRYNHLAVVDSGRAGSEARIHIDGEELTPEEIEVLKRDSNKNNQPKPNKGANNMVKVKLDSGIEYEAAPEVKVALENLQTKLDSSTESEKEAKKKADEVQAKLDAVPDEKTAQAEFAKRFRARLDAEAVAKKVFKKEDVETIDKLSDKELKEKTIKELAPTANLDGKSDEYISARYDAEVEKLDEKLKKDDEDKNKSKGGSTKTDDTDLEPEQKSRNDMIDRLLNPDKKEEK